MNKKEINQIIFRDGTGSESMLIEVNNFSTTISKFNDLSNNKFQLSIHTTPRCWDIDTSKDFDTMKAAKEYYLINLKKYLEDTLKLFEDLKK
jgi:hypothetical protein